MKIKFTFVCLFLIILHVSAKEPIESKDDRKLTTDENEVSRRRGVAMKWGMFYPDKMTETDHMIFLVVFGTCTIGMLIIIAFCVFAMLYACIAVCCYYRRQRGRSASHVITTQQILSPTGETDQLLNGQKKHVNFHRTIDGTLSNIAMDKLSEMMKSVGLLYWNNAPRGTVIRIGSNFILTAWHVIQPIVSTPGRIDNNGRPQNSMNLENLKKKDVVNVGFNKDAKNKEHDCRSGLLPKICFLDRAKDACILELDCDSSLVPAPFKDFRDFRQMWEGTPQSKFVHVIGQHPTTMIVVIDPGCKIISKEDKKVKKIKKWLKANKSKLVRNGHNKYDVEECYEYYYDSDDYLLLDTYLEFGASGGAVVSFTPDGDIALVGVLLQGIPSWYWNKEGIEHGYSSKVRIEVACPISNILSSKEWNDSEKRRIIEQDDTSIKIEEDMETDDGDKNAVDKRLASLTLDD
ncbi:uncharacterized protein LOC132742125 isoform X2 [Ruditapes philippinarum]|uniref:uncharacterized protein LOC132742125 isoform X2 n=1 Tax=Ruditapes philippinarum TaxID=129788 RepID=UPI00295B4E99|nr:uncharacterized protein LOC132742125 isoform X2 [Ruditapes philippinarum]